MITLAYSCRLLPQVGLVTSFWCCVHLFTDNDLICSISWSPWLIQLKNCHLSIYFFIVTSASGAQIFNIHNFFVSAGNASLIREVGNEAEGQGRNNVAFLSHFITGNLRECLELLIKTNRIPEAAFFARWGFKGSFITYLALVFASIQSTLYLVFIICICLIFYFMLWSHILCLWVLSVKMLCSWSKKNFF